MAQILIVCTANICRSPVVAALLRQKLMENGRSHWQVHSVGTWATIRRGPSRYSQQLMQEQGIDISQHRAKMVDAAALANADLILCMEAGHAEALRAEFPESAGKIYLFSVMAGRHYNIQDPYGGELDDYRRMVLEVSQILEAGFDTIVRLADESQAGR